MTPLSGHTRSVGSAWTAQPYRGGGGWQGVCGPLPRIKLAQKSLGLDLPLVEPFAHNPTLGTTT
jgi:hypothetical protein